MDFLFLRTADYKLVSKAAFEYRAAAKKFDGHDTWTDAASCFQRALQLSGKLGRDKPLFVGIVGDLAKFTENWSEKKPSFAPYRYMKTLLEFGAGDPKKFSELSRKIADSAETKKDYRFAEHYYQVETEWHRLGKNDEKAKESELLSAEALVLDSEYDVEVRNNHQAASHKLAQAIETMIRNETVDKDRIVKLKGVLKGLQKNALEGFKKFHGVIDVDTAARKAMEIMSGVELNKALERLALCWRLADLKELRQDTLAETRESLREFMTGQQLDEDGRPIRNIPSLPAEDAPDYEEILEQKMFDFAGRCNWNYGVTAFIEPARRKIEEEHHPILSDLEHLVVNNPFVPPNHELIFLRGLHAGLHGDFLMSCHLLVPQIENSLRYVLEQNGADIITMKGHGLQEAKTLGALLQLPAAIKAFGPELCFELRGALTEKASHDIRNRLAHGFVTHDECFGISGRHVWWLVLRICLALHLNQIDKENSVITEDEA